MSDYRDGAIGARTTLGLPAGSAVPMRVGAVENINDQLGGMKLGLHEAIDRARSLADRLFGYQLEEPKDKPAPETYPGGLAEVNFRLREINELIENLHSQISRLNQL